MYMYVCAAGSWAQTLDRDVLVLVSWPRGRFLYYDFGVSLLGKPINLGFGRLSHDFRRNGKTFFVEI